VSEPTFFDIVQSRQSVRQYQPNHTIPAADLEEILALAHKAPSAWNLQHWRVIVVQDQANKETLFPIAFQQQHVLDASAVFIILGDLQANLTFEPAYRPLVSAGSMSEEVYRRMQSDIERAYEKPSVKTREQAFLNASLFAMQLMLAAKAKGYDTCPMSGFDPDRLVEALHIPERYVPVMMITAGIAKEPAHKTTRLPLEEVVIHESF
jgi:nitroreductase